MELVRSDTPEVTRCIASANVLASRHWPALVYGSFPNALILLIAFIMSLSISVRAAVWLGVPVFFVWNVYVIWLTKSSRRNWAIAGCRDRVCIRLFMHGVNELDVVVLEASEIASMSIRTVEVFIYGPKPKFVEWLVIEPAQAVAEKVSDHIPSLLGDVRALDPRNLDPINQLQVANEQGRLTIGWKWCHPALRTLLKQVAREFPSIVIAPEERSELDLNGIWRGTTREEPDAQQRRMLVQAKRLGFGGDCERLLSVYRGMSFRESKAYMAEIEREEAGTSQ